jgi:hypothetical protein
MSEPLRKRISRTHPVVGEGYRLLGDVEVLQAGDQTARVSLLLSLEHPEGWNPVEAEWLGRVVSHYLEGDGDANERLIRRKER